MYPPITCLCGRPIGHLYRVYQELCMKQHATDPNAPVGPILDQLGITRTCCRARMIGCAEFKDYYNRSNPNSISRDAQYPRAQDAQHSRPQVTAPTMSMSALK